LGLADAPISALEAVFDKGAIVLLGVHPGVGAERTAVGRLRSWAGNPPVEWDYRERLGCCPCVALPSGARG
jgi:hypothetical protein